MGTERDAASLKALAAPILHELAATVRLDFVGPTIGEFQFELPCRFFPDTEFVWFDCEALPQDHVA